MQELTARRAQVVNQLTELQKEVAVILNLLSNEQVMKSIETMRDPKTLSNYITKEFDVSICNRSSAFIGFWFHVLTFLPFCSLKSK